MLNIFGKKRKQADRKRRPYDSIRVENANAAVWRNYDKNREAYLKVSFSRIAGTEDNERYLKDFYVEDLVHFPELLRDLTRKLAQEPMLTPLARRRMEDLATLFEVVVEMLEKPAGNGVAQR